MFSWEDGIGHIDIWQNISGTYYIGSLKMLLDVWGYCQVNGAKDTFIPNMNMKTKWNTAGKPDLGVQKKHIGADICQLGSE